jgi:hypothetical protein
MLSRTEPSKAVVTAGFRPRPEHVGSIHDDDAARTYGYRGALVPGIILYGYLSDFVVQSWGLDWVARGSMRSHSRRPVYEGDRLTIVAQPVREDAAGLSMEAEIKDAEGRVVATGAAALPHADSPVPDTSEYPVLPLADPPSRVGPGEFRPGDRFGCRPKRMSQEDLVEALAMFGQHWPVLAAEGIIPPAQYPMVATRSALASYALATPSIFVSAATQHLGIARVGAELTTSGSVLAAYERKGNHYTDQRHLVFADGRPIALVERTSIYAARRES